MYISGVSERDIDLLLLEEFIASQVFQMLFLNKCNIDAGSFRLIDAQRSVTDSTGESDLEIIYENDKGRKVAILIENKVNACFQKDQLLRYNLRGDNYLNQKKVNVFFTVLVAPQVYHHGELAGFDFRVNYEDILHYFVNHDGMGDRAKYKETLLQSAISKGRSGYQQEPDPQVTQFWLDYWKIAQELAPEFNMERPGNKPAGASFIYFYKNTVLPKNISLVHKLTDGYFDLQFKGMGDSLDKMHHKYAESLEEGMSIVKASKSASIRVSVPVLSLADTVESQKEQIVAGILQGKKLLQWFTKQK